MTRVKDIMHRDVPTLSRDATVLDAAAMMNARKTSGVAVSEGDKVVGILTDRRLLTTFFAMNKEPGKVKVSDVMAPMYRIEPGASAKEAARKIVRLGITRLGVFDGEKFLGWVSLTDLSRELSKNSLMDTLSGREDLEGPEFLCSSCGSAFLVQETDEDGRVLNWRCPKCGAVL